MDMQLDQAWQELLQAQGRSVRGLVRSDVPAVPGVYLWRRDGALSYVGTASNLRSRVWSKHLGAGTSLAGSSLRRNVCELLFAIPPTVTGGADRTRVTAVQAFEIREWLGGCTVAWVERPSPQQAAMYERELRGAYLPQLNRL